MLFSSPVFLFVFLPVCLAAYYLIRGRGRNILLLVMSLLFYAWGEPYFIAVLLVSMTVNWLFGSMAEKYSGDVKKGRITIILTVLWNVGIFFVYKYLNFTLENINALFGSDLPLIGPALPIGISFFTFQAISYVADIYRKRCAAQKDLLDAALYITFFPQLIAGPIVRYETVAEELHNRRENIEDFAAGIKRFVFGLCKKLILSNSAAVLADLAFENENYAAMSVALAWIGAIAYTLQIYYDFSGYSDMAIGLGLMFGFHFNENFDYPYCSHTVTEFWRRWHISLGTWFRDYVYFPLGGSRVKSRARLLLNLLVTWLLTGLWHGASWNFIVWGLFYFAILSFEKLTMINKNISNDIPGQLYQVFTLLCIILGWVIFRTTSLSGAAEYIKAMFDLSDPAAMDYETYYSIRQYGIIMIIAVILCMPVYRRIRTFVESKSRKITCLPVIYECAECVTVLALTVIGMAYAVNATFNPFIYFNF